MGVVAGCGRLKAWIVVPYGKRGKTRLVEMSVTVRCDPRRIDDLPHISRLKNSEMKNQGSHIAEIPPEISGEIGPGPILFGAKALAHIVATEPRT